VLPLPHLVVTHVDDPLVPKILPGKTLAVAEWVQNLGPGDAPASRVKFSLVSTVDATIRIDLNGSQNVTPLGLNAVFEGSGTVTVRGETPPGFYYIQACPEDGKDDDANCARSAGAVKVLAVPDLIVSDVVLPQPPVPVVHGKTVALTTFVKNQGSADAGASHLKFALVSTSGAAPIIKIPEAVQVAALPHGLEAPTTGTVTIPNSTPPGAYFVQACISIVNVVEASNQNNCATSVDTLQVQ